MAATATAKVRLTVQMVTYCVRCGTSIRGHFRDSAHWLQECTKARPCRRYILM
jgi:hypothetical protein